MFILVFKMHFGGPFPFLSLWILLNSFVLASFFCMPSPMLTGPKSEGINYLHTTSLQQAFVGFDSEKIYFLKDLDCSSERAYSTIGLLFTFSIICLLLMLVMVMQS